jgi:hypothetical protein
MRFAHPVLHGATLRVARAAVEEPAGRLPGAYGARSSGSSAREPLEILSERLGHRRRGRKQLNFGAVACSDLVLQRGMRLMGGPGLEPGTSCL